MAEGSVGGSDSTISISETSITETSISKTSISKTVISKPVISKTIWVSISSIKDGSFSIGISLSLSFTLLTSIKTMGIWVASIGQRSSGTGDRHVSSVHTGGGLATESIGTIGIGMAEAISITSVQESRVGLCFSVHGGDEGRCNN